MSGQEGSVAKPVIIIGMLLLIVLSVVAGQNPMDMMLLFIGKIFMFLFVLMIVGAPIALIGYVFILCFTNATDQMATPFTEQAKQRAARFAQTFTGAPQKKKKGKGKKGAKPPPKKDQ